LFAWGWALVAALVAARGAAAAEDGALAAKPTCVQRAAELGLPMDDPRVAGAGLLVLSKQLRTIQYFVGGAAVRTQDGGLACWPVGLGFSPAGPKLEEGDGRTPEGWYRTSDKPDSSFEQAILIHYPNANDARAAQAQGRIPAALAERLISAERGARRPDQNTALGGQLLIHGGGAADDWTLGCVALEDGDLRALRAIMPAGQRAWLWSQP
jgi:hypothetical protein